MARSSRNCCLHPTWRAIAVVLVVGTIVAGTIPFSFGSQYVQSDAYFLAIIVAAWWFLSLFWNTFVMVWEAVRKTPMVPGAVVGMDLVITLYGLGGPCLWGIWMAWDIDFQYHWAMNFTNVTRIPKDDRDKSLVCFSVFSGLAILATAIHLVLFVIGCVHEDRRRKAIGALAAKNAAIASSRQGEQSDHLAVMDSAVTAKQAEIEKMEREFGQGQEHGKGKDTERY